MQDSTPVLVTTQHRGVFFGWLSHDQDRASRTLTLRDCRNAIYWSGSHGFLGLASIGPEPGSRIGATALDVMLHDVTSVTVCTESAAKKWSEWE